MIKNISGSASIVVNQSYSNWPSFYNTPAGTGNSLIGQMRYNGTSQSVEVYDGNTWITIMGSYPTIDLAPHVQAAVNWVHVKMAEETRLKELAAKHPSVADALEAVAKAEEQVRIVAALVETE